MFTGIIESMGKVLALGRSSLSVVTGLSGIEPGHSIAVNGICLTAVSIKQLEQNEFSISFDFSPETWSRTSLKELKPNSYVNLERALKAGDRIGGHFLTGHVEDTGKIVEIKRAGESYIFAVTIPKGLKAYIAEKGSIGVDGISLTIAETSDSVFKTAVIPHTMENTILKYKKAGSTVNLEPDVLAKYMENTLKQQKRELTLDFLKENGFA